MIHTRGVSIDVRQVLLFLSSCHLTVQTVEINEEGVESKKRPLVVSVEWVRVRRRLVRTIVGINPKKQFSCIFLATVDPLHARYLIAHKIASGGFGDVYAGVRKKDGMPVALKVIPKKRVREINTVSASLQ